MTMGERIKQMRREYKMTQESLGEKLGIKKAAVQKYEKGTQLFQRDWTFRESNRKHLCMDCAVLSEDCPHP